MYSKETLNELRGGKWKKIDNLIELRKAIHSSLFPYTYWLMGFVFIVINLYLIQGRDLIINRIGDGLGRS